MEKEFYNATYKNSWKNISYKIIQHIIIIP